MRKISVWFLSVMLIMAVCFGCMTATAEETTPQDLTKVLAEAVPGQTVTVQEDTQVLFLSVPDEVTLDLNGKTVAATYASVFGNIVDNSADNAGALQVDANKFLLKTTNNQLPVKTAAGYQFVTMRGFNTRVLNNGGKYIFQPLFEDAAHGMLASGAKATGVTIQVEVTWKSGDDSDSRTFVYNDALVTKYINSYKATSGSYGQMFTLTVSNPDKFEGLSYNVQVVSDTGVKFGPAKLPAEVTKDVTLENEQGTEIGRAHV